MKFLGNLLIVIGVLLIPASGVFIFLDVMKTRHIINLFLLGLLLCIAGASVKKKK